MKIISVVGARPNFMKIAPFVKAIKAHNAKLSIPNIEHILVHTGQHYDHRMSKAFFDDFELPDADINLGIGSGTHAEQVGQTMISFEKVLKAEKPDWVVVVGDVNATLACSVTAKKEWIKCCHIEAGLRSGDMTMPEEINRLVTDRLSDLLLAPDIFSVQNLRSEGVPDQRIRLVGNIMIDTLEESRPKASQLDINKIITDNIINNSSHFSPLTSNISPLTSPLREKVEDEKYAVITIHRPSNVDDKEVLTSLVRFFIETAKPEFPFLWPVHPRTKKQLDAFGLYQEVLDHPGIMLLEPLGYYDMLRLNMGAKVLLTDSGGLQEECTVLGTPFITLRQNTERPVTLTLHGGSGVLAGSDINLLKSEFKAALNRSRMPVKPPLWDGKTAERCLKAILEF
ncbi:MAG: UDP-N-acetylglucosamine 2-epimerase (non-hydrolyzing) [Bacteroidales bacterium]|nr:UDP-N-acetylglucosamine 2-epimerase (non-hydrolyzing) [Bacteroidales bacterium]